VIDLHGVFPFPEIGEQPYRRVVRIRIPRVREMDNGESIRSVQQGEKHVVPITLASNGGDVNSEKCVAWTYLTPQFFCKRLAGVREPRA
jgi:hypothetical protein